MDEEIDETDETDDETNQLQESLDALMEAFHDFDRNLKNHDRQMWERWKAGGKLVSNEFISMYPSAENCVE